MRASQIWGKQGVLVSQMGNLPATMYTGEAFDTNCSAIIPSNEAYLSAIWEFCKSPEFNKAVRRIDQALKVTNATLVKVPFDLARWQAVAAGAGPLPKPHSDDPTQWLFKGHPVGSTAPLQVAAARLLGYRWPQQEPDALDGLIDRDGIVCLPAVASEQPAAERLRAFLAIAYGTGWSPALLEQLLAAVGFAGKGLDMWLRDGFFKEHCRLFHNRPFLWHIWDGVRDGGFSAIVNYHTFDRTKLERLTYTYLNDWIALQRRDVEAGKAGSDGRLVAAQKLQRKLELIRHGEPPLKAFTKGKEVNRMRSSGMIRRILDPKNCTARSAGIR